MDTPKNGADEERSLQPSHLDVLIIGAGISGIGAAYHLQTKCPGKTYAILEARGALGGTWDLFRYPGIRSDSDMHTLGYAFRPWANPQSIADGPSILSYLKETAEAYGIDRQIRYGHKVERVSWSSDRAQWTVHARAVASGEDVTLTCRFLLVCSGYYDYAGGYTPEFQGRERYRGVIVHPQLWSPEIVHEGKRVVVIGSGATAVTLVPELAKKAAHVTMLQRSPTYIVSAPGRDPLADWLRRRFSERTSYAVTRWKNVALTMAFYAYCRRSPERAKRILVGQVRRQVGAAVDVATHFTPSYKPWDQRVCLVPDGDLFEAIRSGRASVETDHIEAFEETGIRLRSGKLLEADLVVTATGLRLKVLGGMSIEVDGQVVDLSRTMTYKGMMCSSVPNLTFAIGYTNASWTLKCDLTNEYACRLINYMDSHGYTRCCPRRDPAVKEELMINFSSGYVRRAIDQFPRQGSEAPWRLYQNYALDRLLLRHAPLADAAMEFR